MSKATLTVEFEVTAEAETEEDAQDLLSEFFVQALERSYVVGFFVDKAPKQVALSVRKDV